jgi:signal transduction histidine kinase
MDDKQLENSEDNVEFSSNKEDDKEQLSSILKDGASKHIESLNALIEEQKNAKTKTKKDYIQKKIEKKREIVLKYMNQLARLS